MNTSKFEKIRDQQLEQISPWACCGEPEERVWAHYNLDLAMQIILMFCDAIQEDNKDKLKEAYNEAIWFLKHLRSKKE